MQNKKFMNADDVVELFDISKSSAYKIIHKLNAELAAKGYLTVAGRVSRKYFKERFYYNEDVSDGEE